MRLVWSELLWVGLGGFVGSIGRYVLGGAAQRGLALAGLPAGTLVVNVVGSLLIGLVSGFFDFHRGPELSHRLLLVAGVLGGFTTFSAFSIESLQLLETAGFPRLLLNIAANVVLGITAAWLGYAGMRSAAG